jgi:hypothetical protein
MTLAVSTAREVWQAFSQMPRHQLVFFILAAVTWLIGANVLVALHYRRMGKRTGSAFTSFERGFFAFNRAEWTALIAVAALTFLFVAIAVTSSPR